MARAHYKRMDKSDYYIYSGFNIRNDHEWCIKHFDRTETVSIGPEFIIVDFPDATSFTELPSSITEEVERDTPRSIQWFDSFSWMYVEDYIQSPEDPFGEGSYLSGYEDAKNGRRKKLWQGEYLLGYLDAEGDEELNS